MSTLVEIESAAETLSAEQQEQLLFFLAARLRSSSTQTFSLRTFGKEEMDGWLEQDEADMVAFQSAR